MTNGWTDIRNADVILAMGGNPAENHPVGFRFVMEAKRNRNAKLVCVDPRFNRTAAVADRFVQIRAGTDIAFLGGLIHYALTHNRYHDEYVRLLHERAVPGQGAVLRSTRSDGVFSGWDDREEDLHGQIDLELRARRAGLREGRSDARSIRAAVFQVMKQLLLALHAGDGVEHLRLHRRGLREGGRAHHLDLHARPASARSCMRSAGRTTATRCSSFTPRRCCSCCSATSGGLAAGSTRCAVTPTSRAAPTAAMAYHNLPGYIADPEGRSRRRSTSFIDAVTPKPLRPNSMNFWSNTDRFVVSQLKAYYGTTATRDNEFGYDCIPSCRSRRRAPTRTGAGPTSSTTCIAARWRGSSASA